MKLINNTPDSYAVARNIFVFGKECYKSVEDVFTFGNKLKHRLTGSGHNLFYKGLFYSFTDQKNPCHFFNSINLGKNPWIVTFETTLPRLGKAKKFWYDLAVKQLTKPSCKKLIALSQCTYDRQVQYLKANYPNYLDIITSKMMVLHPPQELLIIDYSQKNLNPESIVFTLVGADFFRKGGREVLNVFNELIPAFPFLKLNIISSLDYGDYASKTVQADYDKAIKLIQKFPDNITHHTSLPNAKVLEIMRNTHVGLLPSWADTYGYSILEAQAAGCPVITTDLRAFPEINNEQLGWLIPIPLNDLRDAKVETEEERILLQKIIEQELKKRILKIIENPDTIKVKGLLCMERIRKEHSLEKYKLELSQLYHEHFKGFAI